MLNTLSDRLRRIAMTMVWSYETPSQILKILEIFRDLLSDRDNFVDPSKWGTTEDGKKIGAFAFSEKGLKEIDRHRNRFKPFEHVYRAGVAGIKSEKYNLLYFLSNFLVFIMTTLDALELKHSKEKWEENMLDALREKLNPVRYRLNSWEFNINFPDKKYSDKEYEQAKTRVLDTISKVEDSYKAAKKLTSEEEDYIMRKKQHN